MGRFSSALFVLAASACATGPAARPASDTRQILQAQTQELLDAVAPGDKAVWERYLHPDASYLSEGGVLETKSSLLAQLDPLPAGISGTLKVVRFDVREFGDAAVAVYEAHEAVSYFGHPVTADYRMTDTWLRGSDGWRLIASQVHAVEYDPPAIPLPAEQLDEYVGTYRVGDAVTYTIRREGERLVGQREGRKPQELLAEVRDVLFVPGQPRSRKIFTRDAEGRVTGFLDRREGLDIPWRRSAP